MTSPDLLDGFAGFDSRAVSDALDALGSCWGGLLSLGAYLRGVREVPLPQAMHDARLAGEEPR